MVVLKSILMGLAFDLGGALLLLMIFLLLMLRSGMFGIGPLRTIVAWTILYFLAAFILGFVWRYHKG